MSYDDALEEIESLKESLKNEKRLRAKETNALLDRLTKSSQLIIRVLQADDTVLPVDITEEMERWLNESVDDLTQDLKNIYEENHQLKDKVRDLIEEKEQLVQQLLQWERSSDKHY